ncbi:hypothetical protein [Lewinella sp. IMCC34183]|uniref:hypothetical protein n=1 Tax=Lewinella sp. IMCC34183 TaxID=2248762 RepID=UPI000E251A3C|nr:hypothetical protein [Lewinella sp. IMCC34183]
MSATDQVVIERINRLHERYQAFVTAPAARVALWQLAADEYGLFRAYVDRETSLAGQGSDLLLKFATPFRRQDAYASALVEELARNIFTYNDDHAQYGIELAWRPAGAGDTPRYFVQQLAAFGRSLPDLGDGKVVAYLMPPEVGNWGRLAEWLLEAAAGDIPETVRLMVIDFKEDPVLDRLAAAQHPAVMPLDPRLDVPGMMKEISRAAGGDKPGAVFQRHFIDLAKAAAERRMADVDKHANLALGIAVAEDWKHLQVTVHNTVGTAWMNGGKLDQALAEFEKAERIARIAWKLKEDGATANLANTLFFQGAALSTDKRHERAAEVYHSIVPVIEDDKNQRYSLLEAWRMTGQSRELAGTKSEAVEANLTALRIGEGLDEKLRESSTLPYVGAALIRLSAYNQGRYRDHEIDGRMTELFGPRWRERSRSNS